MVSGSRGWPAPESVAAEDETCPECGFEIKDGDPIFKYKDKWICGVCAEELDLI